MKLRGISAQSRIAVALAVLVGFSIFLEGSWRWLVQAAHGSLNNGFIETTAAGDLDPTFGIVTTPILSASYAEAHSLAIQSNGKIVLAGEARIGADRLFAVARYNTTGTLDTSFSGDGIVTTFFSFTSGSAYDVAIQADGKIIVVGTTYGATTLLRYNVDGTLDTSFSVDGIAHTQVFGAENLALAIQPDGKIVVTGGATNLVVSRLTANGDLDTSFGSGGTATTSINSSSSAEEKTYDVAIQTDGKIVVAGYSHNDSTGKDEIAVVRYNSDGSLDTSFHSDGIVTTPIVSANVQARSVALQTDGKIVVAGETGIGGSNSDFVVVRYDTSGTLDTTFGSNGIAITPFGATNDGAKDLVIQANGKIVAAGYTYSPSTNLDFALARYNSNGTLDTSFSSDGKIITSISSSADFAKAVALQADGKIVAAGLHDVRFAVIRYEGDGACTAPSNLTSPADRTVCVGAATSFSVTPNSTGFSYEWRKDDVILNNNGNISGVNTATLSIGSVGAGDVGYYTVKVSACGTDVISTPAKLALETISPTIDCPSIAAQSANADAACQAIVPDVRALVRAQSSDNCTANTALSVSQNPVQGSTVSGLGSHPITVTVTDAADNSSLCNVAFTVTDNTAPTLTNCPTNMTASATSGAEAAVTYTSPTATDNCGTAPVNCQPATGSTFPVGTTTVNCTATDASNNSASCSFTVTVSPCVLTISPATLPDGVLDSAYAQIAFSAAGGSNPTFTLTNGALPVGMSFSNGILSGTPTQAGVFNFTIAVTAGGCSGSSAYTLNVGLLNLQATGGEVSVTLNWTQAGLNTPTGFNLYRKTSNDPDFALIHTVGTTNTYTDTTVTANTQYFYKLKALNANGESSYSNQAVATPVLDPPVITHTPPAPPAQPGLPVTITATVTDNTSVQNVKLFFRTIGATTNYIQRTMNLSGNNLYQATLQTSEVVVPGVEYYLEASDQFSTTRAGQPGTPYRLTLADRPYLVQINPLTGAAAGNTPVTLTGHNFKAGAVVTFDNAIAAITSFSPMQIICTTPPHFPATVDVRVLNPDGKSDTKPGGFTYTGAGGTLSLPDMGGPKNVPVQIPINVTGVQGLMAADLKITFNSNVLNAVSVANGTLTNGWTLARNLTTPGEVRLALASGGGPVSGSGTLAVITFNVPGDHGSTTPLTFAEVTLNGGALTAIANPGSFLVAPVFKIDGTVQRWVNGVVGSPLGGATLTLGRPDGSTTDFTTTQTGTYLFSNLLGGNYTLAPSKSDEVGAISSMDASLVMRHANGDIPPLTGNALIAADVDKSGQANSQDAAFILNYLVEAQSLPFPGAGRVWEFVPSVFNYTPLNADQTSNFVAILLGDVSSITGGNRPGTVATLSLPSVSVPNGAEFALPLTLNLPSGALFGAELRIVYDPAVMTVLGVEGGALATNWMRAVNLTTPGLVRVALAHSQALTGNGELLRLRVRAHGAIGNTTALTITQARLNEGGIGTTLNAGRVTLRKRAVAADFDGDGKTDLAIWRGPTGDWLTLRSTDNVMQPVKWGTSNAPYEDLIVPADYDGDGKADIAVWRPLDGNWYIIHSATNTKTAQAWGTRGDVPVPGDYDGDGKADLAVWRPSDGRWYVLRSTDGGYTIEAWGTQGDLVVPGDYDGDGKADLAVWRPSNGTWYIKRSSGGQQVTPWGAGYAPYFDMPVAADYDGDGQTDLAVWRGADSLWYIRKSSDGQPQIQSWGANYAPYHDVPVPGDYDGDGKADIAVWRSASGTWYVLRSSDGTSQVQPHGQSGDTPVTASGVR